MDGYRVYRLVKSEHAFLLIPLEWQSRHACEFGSGEIRRMTPVEDGPRDIGAQEGEPNDARDIRTGQAFAPGNGGETRTLAVHEFPVQVMCLDDELGETQVRPCLSSVRIARLKDHLRAHAGTFQLRWHGQGHAGCVVRACRGWSDVLWILKQDLEVRCQSLG